MTPDERELILDFFSRVAEQGAADKDRAAEALISQELRRNPDAAYLLVQTAIVYEHQLAELEDRVRELEQQLAGRDVPDAGDGRGSFLGGRLGQPRGPVRNTGAGYGMPRANTVRDHDDDDDRDDGDDRPARSSPWSQTPGPAQSDGFRGTPQQPSRVEIREPVRAQAAGGGGFLRAAMATAAGVAGGLMLGESLKGLLGGDAHAGDGHKSGDDASGHQQGELNEASDEAFFDDGGGDDGGSLDI